MGSHKMVMAEMCHLVGILHLASRIGGKPSDLSEQWLLLCCKNMVAQSEVACKRDPVSNQADIKQVEPHTVPEKQS